MTVDLRTVIRDKVAEAIYHARRPYKSLGDDENAFIYRQSAEAAIAAHLEALGGLSQEEQWVPVDADGERWAPRGKALALAALDVYGVGGPLDFKDTVPVVRVEREVRWVSGWTPE